MKTIDKIKIGLGVCVGGDLTCKVCPYYSFANCQQRLMLDAMTYIRYLEAKFEDADKMDTHAKATPPKEG